MRCPSAAASSSSILSAGTTASTSKESEGGQLVGLASDSVAQVAAPVRPRVVGYGAPTGRGERRYEQQG
ncbi:MAG TPA: hypothetical protein VHM65_03390 [Candidatus Lustribacter sp.]|nr:hypothetical protein [Candidatus Lustribacter sp.]